MRASKQNRGPDCSSQGRGAATCEKRQRLVSGGSQCRPRQDQPARQLRFCPTQGGVRWVYLLVIHPWASQYPAGNEVGRPKDRPALGFIPVASTSCTDAVPSSSPIGRLGGRRDG